LGRTFCGFFFSTFSNFRFTRCISQVRNLRLLEGWSDGGDKWPFSSATAIGASWAAGILAAEREFKFAERGLKFGDRWLKSAERRLKFGDCWLKFGDRWLNSAERGLKFGDCWLKFGDRGLKFGDRGLEFDDRRDAIKSSVEAVFDAESPDNSEC